MRGTVKRLVGAAGLAGTGEVGDESTDLFSVVYLVSVQNFCMCVHAEQQ